MKQEPDREIGTQRGWLQTFSIFFDFVVKDEPQIYMFNLIVQIFNMTWQNHQIKFP